MCFLEWWGQCYPVHPLPAHQAPQLHFFSSCSSCSSPCLQVWFKNRRAKFRKKQRSLQKEQLQKQKEAEGSHGEGKTEAPTPDTQLETDQPPSLHSGDPPAELHLSLSEQSASESAPEDQPDREEDPRAGAEDPKTEKSPGAESKGLGCKRGSPKAGEAWQVLWVLWPNPGDGQVRGDRGLGMRGGSEQGVESAVNTRHSDMTHYKGLRHSRPGQVVIC